METSQSLSTPSLDCSAKSDSVTTAHPRRSPVSLAYRATVLGGIMIPVALVPFLLTRRRLSLMNRKVDEMTNSLAALRRDTQGLVYEVALRRDEIRQSRASLRALIEEVKELRSQTQRLAETHTDSEASLMSQVQRTRKIENDHFRQQRTVLRHLGPSLANIAAFMHETQLERGYSSRAHDKRIESLREIALVLERLHVEEGVQPCNIGPPKSPLAS